MAETETRARITLDRKDLWKMFYWCQWFTSGNNYEKFESQGFTNSLLPAFDKLYTDDQDKLEAYKRHQTLFLTECQCAKMVIGITAAMEERYANEGDICLLYTSLCPGG